MPEFRVAVQQLLHADEPVGFKLGYPTHSDVAVDVHISLSRHTVALQVREYGFLPTNPPPIEDWSPTYYVYADVPDVPRASGTQEISVLGSCATAWAPPRIYSVTPSRWPAGATTTFTITGEGFGYGPELAILGVGTSSYTNSCASASLPGCNTRIVATVTIDASTAGGTVENIRVTAGGLNLSGFLPVQIPGQTGEATAEARTLPYDPPVPQIRLGPVANGTICANGALAQAPVAVVVGQRIAFSGCVPPGVGPDNGETWSPHMPGAEVAVRGWAPSTNATGPPTPVVATNCGDTGACDFEPFYFIAPGSYSFQFEYTALSGLQKKSATVTFIVTGPTATGENGAFFTATPGTVNVWPASSSPIGGGQYDVLEFGNGATNRGMTFHVTASASTGTFLWVQLIDSRTRKYLTSPPTSDGVQGAGLDNWYPYVTLTSGATTTNDSPGVPLKAMIDDNPVIPGEVADRFSAAMYLMWDPSLPGPGQSTCTAASTVLSPSAPLPVSTPSTCLGSIPVPLAKTNWGFGGCAINTLKQQTTTGTTWVLFCGEKQPAEPQKVRTTAHPTWTKVISNEQ